MSHSQLQVLLLLTVESFSIFGCKEYNQSDFSIDHLVMSMCRVFSCAVGRGCLLWLVHSLGKSLLAFALLHSVFQGQICLLLQVSLDFLLLHSSPLKWKRYPFWVLILAGLVGLHITIQLQLLQHCWLGHRLRSLVRLRSREWFPLDMNRSFCHFWECSPELHFGCFCWLWGLLHFF